MPPLILQGSPTSSEGTEENESPFKGPDARTTESQTFRDRMTLKQAKQTYGHLLRLSSNPINGTIVRLVCDHQPRGVLAKVNGLCGEITGKRGRWIEVTMCVDSALYTYRTTPNNLRCDAKNK